MKRRVFLRDSALLSLAGLGAPSYLASMISRPPSDQIRLGLIGAKGMGWANTRSTLRQDNIKLVAISDIDDSVLADRTKGRSAVKTYKDYRQMLEDPDIDAVIIGTPDHWHCRMYVDALDAGKHVYVEKPMANSIEECLIMEAAAKKYNDRVIQVGQWQRSGPHYQRAIEMVRSGMLGNIRLVKCWSYQGWMTSTPVKPDGPVPDGVDYDMWLGPAPKKPFNPNRFHFTFRWFWDYAGGLMTDWGVHEIDIALYAMGVRAPKSVLASGGKFAYPDDATETPDTLQAVFEYEDFNMLWEHALGIDGGNYGRTEGISFIGNQGTLVVDRQGFELIPETQGGGMDRSYKIDPRPAFRKQGSDLDRHTANWVKCMRDGNPEGVNCGPITGSVAAINAHMGNVAFKTGRKVYWDQEKNQFINDEEANKLVSVDYHNGWKKPKIQ